MLHHLTNAHIVVGSAILGGIICALIYHLTRLHLYKKASKFPGPPGLPFLGNALDFTGNNEDILKNFVKISESYSSPCRIWLGPKLLIFLSRPEQIKIVLYSDKAIEKSELYHFYRPWMGNGLFTAPAAIWRVHRRLIEPTFNSRILESFVDIFAAQSRILIKKLEPRVDGTEFQINDNLSLCTLDIICETAMGVTMEAQTTGARTYLGAVEKAFSVIYQRVFHAWLHPDVIFNLTQLGRDQKETLKILHGFTNDVTRIKAAAFRNHLESAIDESDETCDATPERRSSHRRKVYLDHLMELTHNEMKFSQAQLREEVDTMIVAGSDTTSRTLAFVMLMLASYQDVQDKAYQELEEIYGTCDIHERNVTHEDLPRMKYMERVIKETMRVFPLGGIVTRAVTEDLNIGEYTLPKGCTAVVSILAVHRNKEYWTDPLKFDPDRFLPDEIGKRHPQCYLAFSAGPRNCIGSRFAMMAMKTILATILRRYRLKKDNVLPINEIRLKSDTLIAPVDPITLRIENRI